jgi:hypothetical protein
MYLEPIGMLVEVKVKVKETLHSAAEMVVAETSAVAKARTQCKAQAVVAVVASASLVALELLLFVI